MKESSATTSTMAPLLLRKVITSIFITAEKSLVNLTQKYKLLQFIHHLFIYSFLFFLRLLPSLFPSFNLPSPSTIYPPLKPHKPHHIPPPPPPPRTPTPQWGDSSISRALSQLLSLMNQIPVASRKYELVRSLTDKLIDENLSDGFEPLRQVNRSVLSAAFSRTLSQLEAAMLGQERERVDGAGGSGPLDYRMNRVLRAVLSFGDVARSRLGGAMEEVGGTVGSAEKLAAELLWLAQKLTGNGSAEEAVSRWGSASILASLSLSAEPRLQGSLVKITAFLFKQAKEMGEDECEKEKKEELMQRRMEMLMLWLPLLCRGSNGTDAPVLNRSERMEVEKSLEVNIEMLQQEEQQEKVLALWLHNFSTTPSSEWPNLHACYARWCDASRKLLLV